jgi:SAM-dependent methyltransferase
VLIRLEPIGQGSPGRSDVDVARHPMRKVTIDVAEGRGWDHERALEVTALFDGLASGWSERVGTEAVAPLLDALDRGHVAARGACLEVGSGTGNVTPVLTTAFDLVVCADLSWEMLRHAPADLGCRIRADAATLPLRPHSIDVVALVNAFLFPHEVDRILQPGGVVVWVSGLGDRTPIYLPPEQVLESLPGDWGGVSSHSGIAEWLVARRSVRSL